MKLYQTRLSWVSPKIEYNGRHDTVAMKQANLRVSWRATVVGMKSQRKARWMASILALALIKFLPMMGKRGIK